MDEQPRRWFAFRLRTLFVVVAVVACLAWLTQWAVRYYFPDVFFHDFYFYIGSPK
jgi:hypothetical protein